MTADISSNVAEKAVCWCEGRKNRRSLVMGRRFAPGTPSFRHRRARREFPSKPTRACIRDGVYRPNRSAMVPLLTLPVRVGGLSLASSGLLKVFRGDDSAL